MSEELSIVCHAATSPKTESGPGGRKCQDAESRIVTSSLQRKCLRICMHTLSIQSLRGFVLVLIAADIDKFAVRPVRTLWHVSVPVGIISDALNCNSSEIRSLMLPSSWIYLLWPLPTWALNPSTRVCQNITRRRTYRYRLVQCRLRGRVRYSSHPHMYHPRRIARFGGPLAVPCISIAYH